MEKKKFLERICNSFYYMYVHARMHMQHMY